MRKTPRVKSVLCVYLILALCAAILFCLVNSDIIGLRCIFRDLTGFRCPGCGNTSALLALLNGNILIPLSYNLLFYPEMLLMMYILVYIPYIYIKEQPPSKTASAILFFSAASLILWGIIRNFINI